MMNIKLTRGGIIIRISELSQKTGVSLRSLRYYEEMKLLHPTRQENGYREYTEADIEKIQYIQLYFSLGLTAKEIVDFLNCAFEPKMKQQCLPHAIEVGEKKLGDIKKHIEILRKAESQLEERISKWKELLNQTEELK